jgi:hypothetical protein
MAAVVDRTNPDNYDGQFGGGSLVHPWWVVTAGHLVEGKLPGDVDVVLGAHNLQSDTAIQRVHVQEIIRHPNFNSHTLDCDVALLRLSEPAASAYTNLWLVDETALQVPGVMATVLGWGDTAGTGTVYSEVLLEVQMPIVSLDHANEPAYYDGALTTNMLAAGYEAGGKDASNGDSGGPLMVPGPGGQGWMLAGIVSFGRSDLDSGAPGNFGIYTKVINVRDFIQTYVSPYYGAWESTQHVAGQSRDPDLDGLMNLGEFALASRPLDAQSQGAMKAIMTSHNGKTYPAVSFHKPVLADDVDYRVFYAGLLNQWTPLDPAAMIIITNPVPGDATVENWTVLGPQAIQDSPQTQGYFRLSFSPSSRLVSAIRPLAYQQSAQHALTELDPLYPGAPVRYMKRYRLQALPVGTPVSLTLRSQDFDVQLEVLDEAQGQVLFQSYNNSGGGHDERINFTPQPGISYLCRVTSADALSVGNYTLATFPALSHLPAIGVPQILNGSLTTSDPWDPNFFPESAYHYQDFELVGSPGTSVRVDLSSTAFDSYLVVIDRETGGALIENDDSGPGTDAFVVLSLQEGRSYVLRVSTAVERATGPFTLTTSAASFSKLTPPQNSYSALDTTDPQDPLYTEVYYMEEYELTGVTAGQTVCLDMVSEEVNAQLTLVNKLTGQALQDNDDYGQYTDARLIFTVEAGTQYMVRASTSVPKETGNYRLSAHVLETVTAPAQITRSLAPDDNLDPNYTSLYYIDDYQLAGLTPGRVTTVSMNSAALDSYLYLLDQDTGDILAENDDYSGLNARITFTVQTGRKYLIRTSSAGEEETGSYTLIVQ